MSAPGGASAPAAAPPAVGERRVLLVVCGALLATNLARLLFFRFFPTDDGPIHLEIARVLDALWRGEDGAIARYFRLNPSPQPNWLVYLALVPLSRLFGPLAAEKLLLAGYVVLLPAAFAYALGALRREGRAWLVLAFPLTFNYLVHLGFYNFSYSLALFLLGLGWWLRRPGGVRGRATFALAGLLLATGVAHAVSLGALLVTLGVLAVWSVVHERSGGGGRALPGGAPTRADAWLPALFARLLPLALAALPPLALSAVLFTGPTAGEPAYRMSFSSLVKVLAMLHSLVSYDRREIALSLLLAALLAGAAAVAVRQRVREMRLGGLRLAWSDGLLAAAGALLVLYFAVPTGFAGGGFFSQRLQLQMLLLVVLWLADQPTGPAMRRWVVAGTAALGLGWAALHYATYARLEPLLAEYVSLGPHLLPESTVLSLSFVEEHDDPDAPGAVFKPQPFAHAAGYLTALFGVADLGCYQADRGYFPILYRDEVNPYRHLASDADLETPGGIDLLAYERTGGRVDQVVLWGLRGHLRERPDVRPLLAQLDRGWERVAVSRPIGLGELYRRRGPADGRGATADATGEPSPDAIHWPAASGSQ